MVFHRTSSDVQGKGQRLGFGEAAHCQTFKQLRNKYTSLVSKATANYHIESLSSSFTNPSKFWRAANRNKSHPFSFIPSYHV